MADKRLATKVLDHLQAHYGYRLHRGDTEAMRHKVVAQWCRALEGIEPGVLRIALNKITCAETGFDKEPPTPAQFRSLCFQKSLKPRSSAYDTPTFPCISVNRELAKFYFAEIKKQLNTARAKQ